MSNCSCCGSSVPEGQSVCSMCYGDMDYGSDGYYKEWAENQEYNEYNEDDEYILQSSDDFPF